jgi:hypothetical protein
MSISKLYVIGEQFIILKAFSDITFNAMTVGNGFSA